MTAEARFGSLPLTPATWQPGIPARRKRPPFRLPVRISAFDSGYLAARDPGLSDKAAFSAAKLPRLLALKASLAARLELNASGSRAWSRSSCSTCLEHGLSPRKSRPTQFGRESGREIGVQRIAPGRETAEDRRQDSGAQGSQAFDSMFAHRETRVFVPKWQKTGVVRVFRVVGSARARHPHQRPERGSFARAPRPPYKPWIRSSAVERGVFSS